MLIKKSIRMRESFDGPNYRPTSRTAQILVDILQLNNHDDEAKEFLERSLATNIKKGGENGGIVARSNQDLAVFHHKIFMKVAPSDARTKALYTAKSYAEEAVRICTKMHPPKHVYRVECESVLSDIMKLVYESFH